MTPIPPEFAHSAQDENRTRHQVDFERVRLLYAHSKAAVSGVMISAVLFTAFFWVKVPTSLLLGWLFVLLLVNLLRSVLIRRFQRKLAAGEIALAESAQWERRFYFGLFASATTWGVVSWFPYGDALLPYILYIAFLLVAMSAASIMSLITSFRMGVTFLSMTLLPLTIRLFTLQDYSATMTGITCILFYVIYLRMAQRLHLSVIENISLRIENRDLALRDSLTGLWNRRQLNNYIQWLEARASRGNAPYCVLLMDLDRFKTYNDTHGHAAGDQLLKDIAKVLGDLLRASDLPVRYGGEEFLMVLPDSSLTDAAEVAERIRANISSETNAEASIGVAALQPNEAFDQLVKRADAALYRAKAGGRNQVVVAESDQLDRT